MAFVATDLKDLLTLNVKSRHDNFTDQYNRIFMIKLIMVCTIVMGISWYSDSINCIVPGKVKQLVMQTRYVRRRSSSAYVLNGLYVLNSHNFNQPQLSTRGILL